MAVERNTDVKPSYVVTRRSFIRLALLGTGGIATAGVLAACGGSQAATSAVAMTSQKTSATTTLPTTAATSSSTSATASAAAMSSTTITSQQVKLVAGAWWAFNTTSGFPGFWKGYQRDHPNVTLEVQASPFNLFVEKVVAQVASGTAPDVLAAENSVIFDQFVHHKVLEDLTSYFAETKGFTTKDFFPKLMNRYTVDGKPYGVPYDNQPVCNLFFSPQEFQKAGVATPSESWTWNDALAAADKLTERSGDRVTRYGINVGWTSVLYAFGGSQVDDVANPTKCTLDQPGSMKAVQFYVDLIYKYKVMPSPQALQATGGNEVDLYSTGKLAMDLNGFWVAVTDVDQFKGLDTKTGIGPKGPDGTQGFATGGTAFCITAASKHKDVAWNFVSNWMGDAGHKAEYKAAKLPGACYPPAYIPAFQWYEQQPNYIGNNVGSVISAADKFVVFAPGGIHWPEVNSKVVVPGMDLISRQQKPVSYLSTIASQATQMLQKLDKGSS